MGSFIFILNTYNGNRADTDREDYLAHESVIILLTHIELVEKWIIRTTSISYQ